MIAQLLQGLPSQTPQQHYSRLLLISACTAALIGLGKPAQAFTTSPNSGIWRSKHAKQHAKHFEDKIANYVTVGCCVECAPVYMTGVHSS